MRSALAAALGIALGATAVGLAAAAGDDPLRQALIGAPIDGRLGGDTTVRSATDRAFTLIAPNANEDEQRLFAFGNRVFNTDWAPYPGALQSFDGIGPTFNSTACAGCHLHSGRGEPPAEPDAPMESMLVRLSAADGSPHPAYGDQLQDHADPGVPPEGRAIVTYETVSGSYGDGTPYMLLRPHIGFTDLAFGPLDDALTSARVAPAMVGLGLLEAVPLSTLQALADSDDADGDGISGRINWLTQPGSDPAPGRFGWKANSATLDSQTAAAAFGDIGITSGLHPRQNCPAVQAACLAAPQESGPEMSDSFFERLVAYTRLLGVPEARGLDGPHVRRGETVFRSLGCAQCHIPTLRTEAAASPAVAGQTFHPFTDLLVHDMGEGLADHRPDGSASGSEWRTAPLWGLGLVERVNGHLRLLHDGRARGFAEAILWHGGEAEKAKEAFRSAPADDRAALIAFLYAL